MFWGGWKQEIFCLKNDKNSSLTRTVFGKCRFFCDHVQSSSTTKIGASADTRGKPKMALLVCKRVFWEGSSKKGLFTICDAQKLRSAENTLFIVFLTTHSRPEISECKLIRNRSLPNIGGCLSTCKKVFLFLFWGVVLFFGFVFCSPFEGKNPKIWLSCSFKGFSSFVPPKAATLLKYLPSSCSVFFLVFLLSSLPKFHYSLLFVHQPLLENIFGCFFCLFSFVNVCFFFQWNLSNVPFFKPSLFWFLVVCFSVVFFVFVFNVYVFVFFMSVLLMVCCLLFCCVFLSLNGPCPVVVVVALSRSGQWRWQQQSQWWVVALASNSGCAGQSTGAAAVAVRDGIPLRPARLSGLSSHSDSFAPENIAFWEFHQTKNNPKNQRLRWKIKHFKSFTRPRPIPKNQRSCRKMQHFGSLPPLWGR